MMHIFTYVYKLINERRSADVLRRDQMAGWCVDPLSHPDIKGMSERERADLQFDPHYIRPE